MEEDKLDAISGATDSWGKNFAQGKQYKNVKTNTLIQNQEFYGKKFLVKDQLQLIAWKMSTESKKIGSYACFKATTSIPTADLNWYNFSWSELRNKNKTDETKKRRNCAYRSCSLVYTRDTNQSRTVGILGTNWLNLRSKHWHNNNFMF